MASVSRSTQLAKVFKVLKKQHYKPVVPDPERPVMEQLLLACCLENAHYDAANEAYAALDHTFFDWNEVRVTSIAELSEVMSGLPEPREAAHRVKRVLQSVFEETFSFDLEEHRKNNLGPTIKWLKKLDGTTNFTVSYLVQSALGGHAIPIDGGTLTLLRIVDLVSDKDVQAGVVPGLERAIAKAKGIEFGSLLHQFAADFTANPYSPAVRSILLEINPDAKDRLPKRRARKQPQKQPPTKTPPTTKAKKQTTAEKKAPEKKAPEKRRSASRKKKAAAEEKPASTAKKDVAATRKKTAPSKEKRPTAKTSSASRSRKKKSAGETLSKRKPR